MSLAEPGDPLVLADGRRIDPKTGKEIKDEPTQFIEIPNNTQAQKIVASTRRRVADLPDIPKRMAPISVVLSYSLFGMPDEEIAIATGIALQQIQVIKSTDAYAEMHDTIVKTIMDRDADDIRVVFRNGAKLGAKRIVNLLESENEAIQLAAAKDLMDRDGHRPNDIIEHRHKMEGGLVIKHVRASSDESIIDLDYETITDG